MIKIDDFGDFNYKQIAFDISEVDKKALRSRLGFDYINHLHELDHAGYFAIWNYDCQGFLKESDIYFWGDRNDYSLYKLIQRGDEWYRELISERLVRYELQMT